MGEHLSVIIPSFNCRYVNKTVEDIFNNATGEVEVIVLLDGYIPDPPIKAHENLIVVEKPTQTGMRNCINVGVKISTGKYIMKCDDHCAFSKGFDEALIKGSQEHQISIPSRYSLDVINWKVKNYPVSYEYAAYPYVYLDKHRYGIGLYSKKWEGTKGNNPINKGVEQYYWKENRNKHILIDEIMIFHGSCWFMSKDHFLSIGGLDEVLFKTLYQEPQELSFKTWLSGGRVVINKNAWYAHMHKGKDFGDDPNIRGYRLDLTAMRATERFGTTLWMNNCWKQSERPIKWLIDKFWPIPGWPIDWEIQKLIFEEKYLQKEMELCKKKYNLKAI